MSLLDLLTWAGRGLLVGGAVVGTSGFLWYHIERSVGRHSTRNPGSGVAILLFGFLMIVCGIVIALVRVSLR